MNFEDCLKDAGSFGRFQKCAVCLLSLPVFVCVLQVFVQVFSAGTSDHWCRSWGDGHCGEDVPAWPCEFLKRNLSVPVTSDPDGAESFQKCLKYDVTGEDIDEASVAGAYSKINASLDVIPCDEGWVHDTRTFTSTVVIDFELVCERSHLPNLAQSLYFAGYLVGSLISGPCADLFGRRKVFLVSLLLAGCCSLIITFSTNMAMYMALRLVTAGFAISLIVCALILVNEFVATSKRVLVSNVVWVIYALGFPALAGLAKVIHNWRHLHLAISLPFFVLLVPTFLFVPESPRWLVVKGRLDEADKVLRRIARINRKQLRDDFTTEACHVEADTESRSSLKDLRVLLSQPRILFFTINCGFNWAVLSLVYYGLTLSTSSLGIDPYLSFVVSGAIEIPASILCFFLPEIIGRKASTFCTMFLAGSTLCITPILPPGIFRALVAMLGKFFITASFSVLCSWSAELMPTILRSSGLAFFFVCSRVGGVIAPLLLILGETWESLPSLVFGVSCIAAGLLCLFFPETKGVPLPATLEDMRNLFSNERNSGGRDKVNEVGNEKGGEPQEMM